MWTYETMEYPLPISISYQTFQITDTAIFNEKFVFVIENDYDDGLEFMHVEESRVYFWDNVTGAFQLTYDFGSDSTYLTYWGGACHSDLGIAVTFIDSTSSFLLGTDTIVTQHLSIVNSGTIEEPWLVDVYKNIGPKYGGVRIKFGYGFCDFSRGIGILRCFENDSVNYNFVGYACDSTWLSLSTTDHKNISQIVYPNPTSGLIHITDLESDVPYELYNIQGIKLKTGSSINHSIHIEQPGIFLLRLLVNAKWITRRIVVI